jgi:hypothetical protein
VGVGRRARERERERREWREICRRPSTKAEAKHGASSTQPEEISYLAFDVDFLPIDHHSLVGLKHKIRAGAVNPSWQLSEIQKDERKIVS